MKTILSFLGFTKEETKKAHRYTKAVTSKGEYTKRDDGLEYFISSDLLT